MEGFERLVVGPGDIVILRTPPSVAPSELHELRAGLPAQLHGRVVVVAHDVEVLVAPAPAPTRLVEPCGCDFAYDSHDGTRFLLRRSEGCSAEH